MTQIANRSKHVVTAILPPLPTAEATVTTVGKDTLKMMMSMMMTTMTRWIIHDILVDIAPSRKLIQSFDTQSN